MDMVFFLNEAGITVVSKTASAIESVEEYFSWDDKTKFSNFLTGVPYHFVSAVVLDFADEHTEYKWVARLMPWEKAQQESILSQKTQGLLVNITRLKNTKSNKKGRSEEEIKITYLPKSEELNYFINEINKANLIMPFMYSSVFFIGHIFHKKLKKQLCLNYEKLNSPILLVVKEVKKTFRQVFIVRGQIKFTRLIYIDSEVKEGDIAYRMLKETQLFIKHIYNQKVIPYNKLIGLVYISDDKNMKEDFLRLYKKTLFSTGEVKQDIVLETLDFNSIACSGKRFYPIMLFKNVILSHLFTQPPITFYKNFITSRSNNIIKGKKSLLFASVLASCSGLFLIGLLWVDSIVLEEHNARLQHDIVQLSNDKKLIQKDLNLKYDAEDIQEIALFSKALAQENSRNSLKFNIKFFEGILTNNNNIQLKELKWEVGKHFNFQVTKVILSGTVFPFEGSYSQPIAWINSFVEEIKLLPNVLNVNLIEGPVDKKLTTSIVVESPAKSKKTLPFKIRLEIRNIDSAK